jgi:hypothetical protein
VRKQYLVLLSLLFVTAFVSAQQITLSLWPNGTPEFKGASVPNKEFTERGTRLVGGWSLTYVKEVSKPTLTVLRPISAKDAGAAVLVFPGGAYQRLTYDLEGSEAAIG